MRFQTIALIDDGISRTRSLTSAVRRDMIQRLQQQRVLHNKRQLTNPAFVAVFDHYEKTHLPNCLWPTVASGVLTFEHRAHLFQKYKNQCNSKTLRAFEKTRRDCANAKL